MFYFPLSRRSMLLLLVVFSFRVAPSFAQVQYANRVVAEAGIVTDNYKAADSDLGTSATIKPTVLLGYTKLRVSFLTLAAANKEAGLYIKPNVAISAALLGGATVNTYLQDAAGTTPIDSYQLSNNLLNLKVGPSGVSQISFLPTQDFNQLELVFFSTLALGQDIGFYEAYSTVSPLPVTLTAFQGQVTPAGVVLTWATASEHNADQFVVERASGVPEGFRAIGQVQSAGTTTQHHAYQFVDATFGGLSYYRLRQVDLDGTETYSPVVAVKAEPLATDLLVYPNPATETLTVVGASDTRFEVFDQMGRQVQRILGTTTGLQQVDVRSLPSGLYSIQDVSTGQRVKFVKAK